MLVADYAKATNKFVLVIDNTKYHTLAADKKATVLAYYDSIIPEAEIDRIANDTTWGGIQLMDGTQDSGVFTFQVGPDGGDTIVHTLPDVNDHTASGTFALTGDVTTRVKASAYIAMADTAISFVGTEREQIGAVMNRLDYTMANLTNMSTNLSLAKGRIEDADFAAESANLARTQVLQQASMSMLAQANASKQNILALFQ